MVHSVGVLLLLSRLQVTIKSSGCL
ncbi:hypothetical protein E2I00_004002 [Balaenoptera physalus]|uniref:Uncharacterized protein n=1 Tax=Balaenoptera physalus TaxID=9770 RepID=A0A6A1Q7K7_BALPH|nr:hypothetical protein E2I00_004002 [Balaenoptera physalus]